jgi:Uma2 family endonuclease
MSTPKVLLTADDLLRLSCTGKRYELVMGELIEMAPTGGRHGRVAIRIGSRLNTHVEREGLGEVFAAETGFRLERNPDKVRAPDVAFVSKGRLPPGELPTGFLDIVPDLVVEVVSPGDTATYVQAKVEDWIRAGVRLVWVFYPDTRSVASYGSLDEVRILTENDQLQGDPVLPGFSCPVKEIF